MVRQRPPHAARCLHRRLVRRWRRSCAQLRVLSRADEVMRDALAMARFKPQTWQQLEVETYDGLLSVRYAGHALLDELPLEDWESQEEWALEFLVVGRADAKADLDNAIDDVEVRFGAAAADQLADLRIANNAQQFSVESRKISRTTPSRWCRTCTLSAARWRAART